MKRKSVKKISLVGVILLIVSVAMGAVFSLTSKDQLVEGADNGTLQAGYTDDGLTCVPDNGGDVVFSCNITIGSETTGAITYNSFTGTLNTKHTINNTSMSMQGSFTSVVS